MMDPIMIPEEIQKYIEMKKKPLEMTKIVQPMNQIVDRRQKSLVLMPPPKVANVQKFYESLANSWFEDKSVRLWNFTINPDPKKMDKKWSNKQIENWITKEVNSTLCRNKYIRGYILEYVIFYEIGEKNGKFHCNICTKFRGETEERLLHVIKDKIYTKFGKLSLNIKDQHIFKEADRYNNKDAAYMTHIGHRPKYYKIEHDDPLV